MGKINTKSHPAKPKRLYTFPQKGGYAMKTIIHLPLIALLALFITSCNSYRYTTNINQQDDIYFSPKEARKNPTQKKVPAEQNISGSAQNQQYSQDDLFDEGAVTEESGSVVNNYYGDVYYDSDDYYDYAYSARIRRFHNPSMGLGFYDPFYTNMYFYNYDPFFWGSSIYMSYGFWNPHPWGWGMGTGWGWNSGWGWGGYYGWGGGWGSGWGMGPGWGWGGNYWAGYNHGYWNGYYNGLANNYYFNSLDRNSHYNGPRNNSTGSGSALTTNSRDGGRLAQAYQQQVGLEKRTDVPRNNITGIQAINQLDNGAITRQSIDTRTLNPEAGAITRGNNEPISRPDAVLSRDPGVERGSNVREGGSSVTPAETGKTSMREGATTKPDATTGRNNNVTPVERAMTPQRINPQERPAVHPVPNPNRVATSPTVRQPQVQSQRQSTPSGSANRANTYSAPKRNPHAYQPHTAPGTEQRINNGLQGQPHQGSSPSYNRGGTYSGGTNTRPSHPEPSKNGGSFGNPRSGGLQRAPSHQSSPSRIGGSYNSPSPSAPKGGGGSFSSPSPSRSGGGGFSSPSSSPSRSGGSSSGRSPR
jgi:hypothetical protein